MVSKNIANRTVTVSVIPGGTATQTIVVFVNRAVTTTESSTNMASTSSQMEVRLSESPLDAFVQFLNQGLKGWLQPGRASG